MRVYASLTALWVSTWLLLIMGTQLNDLRCIMYLTGQHNIIPEPSLVAGITHVALAFTRSSWFNGIEPVTDWPLFTTIEEVRRGFAPGTKIMVAIGGWGDTEGFEVAARSAQSRILFAQNVRAMLDSTGADGVDIDWEYPGGNGEDYKTTPNVLKAWEITAYPLLLSALRDALDSRSIISAAVPGLPRDMLAFTSQTMPAIAEAVDFLNIMTYDLMNRRDNVTKHHSGIQDSLLSIGAYLSAGLPPDKANFGVGFYVKWFKTNNGTSCKTKPLGCETGLMEDPVTGADLGKAGQFAWSDPVPEGLQESYERAMLSRVYDESGGGWYYWDEMDSLWWTWDPPEIFATKLHELLRSKRVGGVFAWGLGEDAKDWTHLKALNEAMGNYRKPVRHEL